MMAPDPKQAQLDAAARQMGFQNYAQWSAWQTRQDAMKGYNGRGGATAAPAQRPKPAPQPARPVNFLQQILSALGG